MQTWGKKLTPHRKAVCLILELNVGPYCFEAGELTSPLQNIHSLVYNDTLQLGPQKCIYSTL